MLNKWGDQMPVTPEVEKTSKDLIRAFMQFRRIKMNEGEGFKPHQCGGSLKHSEIMLLFAIKDTEKDYPAGVSVSDLSGHMRVKPPSITPIIGSLEKQQMLERSMDPDDRRIIRIRLKDEGNRVIEAKKRLLLNRIKGLVEHLGVEKSSLLAELINETYRYFVSSKQHKSQP